MYVHMVRKAYDMYNGIGKLVEVSIEPVKIGCVHWHRNLKNCTRTYLSIIVVKILDALLKI